MVSIEDIKKLRDLSNVSIGECKKVLEETGGDLDKALEILKKKSADIASRKAQRTTSGGLVVIEKSDNKTAVVVLNCETDFVAKNDAFVKLAKDLASLALKDGAETTKNNAKGMIDQVIQITGENIQLKEVNVFSGNIGSYVHTGKIGAIVDLEKENEALAKDIAMHITALAPQYLNFESIPTDKVTEMKRHYESETALLNKPENIKTKIIEGKLKDYFGQMTLADQSFIKDVKMTIGELLQKENNRVKTFTLYTL